ACDLAVVADTYREYIESATRTPFKALKDKPALPAVIEEEAKVNDATLIMVITKDSSSSSSRSETVYSTGSSDGPLCPWLNLVCGDSPRNGSDSTTGSLLLQNPLGKDVLRTAADVLAEAHTLFGIPTYEAVLYVDGKKVERKESVKGFLGKRIFVTNGSAQDQPSPAKQPLVRYANLVSEKTKATLLLENPVGCPLSAQGFLSATQRLFGLQAAPPIFQDEARTKALHLNGTSSLLKLHGSTLYL
ncbi:UNVERIFIED_CONTAM: hypothetical protein GTU68_065760, partial [Idotea baltica]|nr:hypothetical protein [Idotea baltica]